jgi:hypothetical protein
MAMRPKDPARDSPRYAPKDVDISSITGIPSAATASGSGQNAERVVQDECLGPRFQRSDRG